MNALDWLAEPIPAPEVAAAERAALRQARLTKPPGSLGRLETLAIRLAGLQGRERPCAERVHIAVFAADHGVAEDRVSAFPQAVTAQMIDNFAHGGAAISVLARQLGATLEVIDLGSVAHSRAAHGVRRERIAPSTANLARRPAMTPEQFVAALDAGRRSAMRAADAAAALYIGGDMGIANTTAATALACAYGLGEPAALAGPGTGLDPAGLSRKIVVLQQALALHRPFLDSPTAILRRLGGFEIAALAGACIACAQRRLPVLVDGFICGAAALAACRIRPETRAWLLFAHRSAEPGHAAILDALAADPLLDLGLRLGEGSGAALAVPLLRLACALHADMATFSEAGISGTA